MISIQRKGDTKTRLNIFDKRHPLLGKRIKFIINNSQKIKIDSKVKY